MKKRRKNMCSWKLETKDDVTWVYFCDPDNNILEYIKWYRKK